MHSKKILLLSLVAFCHIAFSQQPADSILKKYGYLSKQQKHVRYYLVALNDYPPKNLMNKILLASARRFAGNLFIVDRLKYQGDLLSSPFIKQLLPANNEWKLSAGVSAKKELPPYLQKKIETYYFLLNDLRFAENLFFTHPFLKTSAKILPEQKILSLSINYRQVQELFINNDSVIFIDVLTTKPHEELGTPGYDLSANKINIVHSRYPAINGEGRHVSIKEDYYDTTDIDLKGRLDYSPLASKNITNHANFMATIIAGAGNSISYAKGAAPAAQISSSSFEEVLPDATDTYLQNNITVQNHSYGTAIDNNYGLNAVAFDKSAHDNEGLLHIFSSGNSGSSSGTAGRYSGIPGYANLTGNFKMAKNILTVGAVDSFGIIAPLSSRGPAYDGRIKPELVAFQKNGTSEAAALVSGTALLLQQYYNILHPGNILPATLAKAILINTADDIDAPGPDFKTGYGNMNAIKAMDLLKQDKIFSGDIKQGEKQKWNISVPPNASLLKITLAWNDTAATPLADKALVNDVDLELKFQGGNQSWQPWVLNSAANIDSLQVIATRQKDSLNNVEQVTVTSPEAGNYEIAITGYDLLSGNQKYYVAYSWDSLNYFKWQAPADNDLIEGGSQSILRWQSSFNGNAKIEYSFASTNSWQPVSVTALAKNYFYWNVPDTISLALLRIKISDEYFYSDTFLITKSVRPTTGYICGDSLMIYWNKIKSIGRYQLYQLGDKYIEPLFSVSDTMAVIKKSILTDQYLAVAPILNDGAIAPKSYAFNYNTQGASCFINAFYADKNVDAAHLTLSLGTLINVAGISFQKFSDTGFAEIGNASVTNQLQYFFDYGPLQPGISYFRAKITLVTGQIIYSTREAVLYTAPGKYVLLPNPVQRNNGITIISDLPDGESIILTDVSGRTIIQQEIQSSREFVNTSLLQAGLYFYRIIKNKTRIATGKLVIL